MPGSLMQGRYEGLLAAALEDPHGVHPEEAARLSFYRERHSISASEHYSALVKLGTTPEEWERRLALGNDITAYLDVVAATRSQSDGNLVINRYREQHGVSDEVHAAAMEVLGLSGSMVVAPSTAGVPLVESGMTNAEPARGAGTPASESPELRRHKSFAVELRRDETVDHHAAAAAALGSDGQSQSERLQRRLLQLEVTMAERKAELEQLEATLRDTEEIIPSTGAAPGAAPSTGTSADGAASSEFDSSVALVTPRTALAGAQLSVTELERDLFAAEQEGGQLSSKFHAGRARLSAVKALLDGREADVYEAEEVARESEGRRRARTSERRLVEERLKSCEERLHARWREHVHLSALPDFQPASTLTNAARWVGVGRFGDEPDADVDASTMRQRAKGKEKRHGADAGYVEFHTACMGVKLSMSKHPRLRNVRIDELWEEVQQQSIPRHEWHAFVRARLLDDPKDLVGIWSPATALFLNVRPLYDQLETTATTVTGALGSLGDNVRNALWRPPSPPPP